MNLGYVFQKLNIQSFVFVVMNILYLSLVMEKHIWQFYILDCYPFTRYKKVAIVMNHQLHHSNLLMHQLAAQTKMVY